MKPDHDLKFFVYVVESPSAVDIYKGRSEGAIVASALHLRETPCVTRTTVIPKALVAALRVGLPEAMSEFPDRMPILHLSAHGSQDGIQLSDGSVVAWSDLCELLVPINRDLDGLLILCMSACEGYSACRMAMAHDSQEKPYFALVANLKSPTWSDTAVGYTAFYHRLAKGSSIVKCVEAMKAASGDESWVSETADVTRSGYLEHLAEVNFSQAAERLRADAEDLTPDTKALERG